MSFDFKIKQGSLVSKNGKLQVVENSEKLVQDCLKDITTNQGDNPHHPNYGSRIGNNSIGNIMDDSFSNQVIAEQIRNTLERKQSRQKNQSTYQKLNPEEILAAIQNIVIERNQLDPRYLLVYVYVLSGAFNQYTFNVLTEL